MPNKPSVVVTGIGPISSIGIGKVDLWNAVLNEKTHVVQDSFYVEDELLDSFYVHKIENFDINDFKLDREIIEWIRDWKNGYDDIDLMYLAAAAKLALDDSSLKYDPENNKVGFIVTHENPGLEIFFHTALLNSYTLMSKEKRMA